MDFNRRSFLKAAGVSLLLPKLESEAASSTGEVKNLFCVALNFGVHPGHFFPSDNDPCSSKVLSLMKENKSGLTVLINTQHPHKGGHGAVHRFFEWL